MQCSLKKFALGMALGVFLNLLFASVAVSQTVTEQDTTETLGTIHITPPQVWTTQPVPAAQPIHFDFVQFQKNGQSVVVGIHPRAIAAGPIVYITERITNANVRVAHINGEAPATAPTVVGKDKLLGLHISMSGGASADHANTLYAAKKWVRDQGKWSSPYYWAQFVLVGLDSDKRPFTRRVPLIDARL